MNKFSSLTLKNTLINMQYKKNLFHWLRKLQCACIGHYMIASYEYLIHTHFTEQYEMQAQTQCHLVSLTLYFSHCGIKVFSNIY